MSEAPFLGRTILWLIPEPMEGDDSNVKRTDDMHTAAFEQADVVTSFALRRVQLGWAAEESHIPAEGP